jgi:hypothetical protein
MPITLHDCMTYRAGRLLSHTTMHFVRGAQHIVVGGRLCSIEVYEAGVWPRVFVNECDRVQAGKIRVTRSMTKREREKRAVRAWRKANPKSALGSDSEDEQ